MVSLNNNVHAFWPAKQEYKRHVFTGIDFHICWRILKLVSSTVTVCRNRIDKRNTIYSNI